MKKRKKRKRNLTRVLFLMVIVLFMMVLTLFYFSLSKLNSGIKKDNTLFNKTTYYALNSNVKYYLGAGKYANEKIDSGYIDYIENNVLIFESDNKKLSINSSLFTEEEKSKISNKFIHLVRLDKETYQEMGYLNEFIDEVRNFDDYFDVFNYENGEILIGKQSEQNLPVVKIPYSQLSLFMSFMFSNKNIVADNMPDTKLTREIDSSKPMIALTFDDGPSKENTIEIVNRLKEYNSAATFFVIGKNVAGKQEILDAVIDANCEIGGHSWDHKSLVKVGATELDKQLYWVKDAVKENTKTNYEITTFRPPYGALNAYVKEKSPYPMIMWDIDTLDWKTRNKDKTVKAVLDNVKDGSIILMHDIHKESKEAALELIPILVEQGYQLVTVSELMEAKGINMEAGKTYYSGRQ